MGLSLDSCTAPGLYTPLHTGRITEMGWQQGHGGASTGVMALRLRLDGPAGTRATARAPTRARALNLALALSLALSLALVL